MARAYCALEKAALDLHRGQPLFFPFAEMQEWNETYRRELIMGLILALDLFRQNGVSVEQTALLEKVRSEMKREKQMDMRELAKKTTAAFTECVEAIGKRSSVAEMRLELEKMAALTEILKAIPERYLYTPH